MGLTSSLRAQRGNPDFGAATGLPRRFAPRNDKSLRVFAPSREPNLLFSREDAKARRWIRAFAAISLAANSPVFACMVKPSPMSGQELDQNANVIVKGTFLVVPKTYSGSSIQFAAGNLSPTYLVKGRKAGTYQISHKDMDVACQSWGWQPLKLKRGARYSGKFWLMRNSDGTYEIAKFLQYPSL
jgi:hypothetical protein